MAKNPTKSISSAASDNIVTGPQNGAAVVDEVNPSSSTDATSADAVGESASTANDTPESASGAAAGEASSEPVKPLTGSDPVEATVAEPDTPTFVGTSPEVEAAASGTNSESSSQEAAAGDAGANAGVSAAFTAEQVNAIRSQILGVTIKQRREFIVYSAARYNNVLFKRGGRVIVDQDGHAELAAANLVAKDWLLGVLVEG